MKKGAGVLHSRNNMLKIFWSLTTGKWFFQGGRQNERQNSLISHNSLIINPINCNFGVYSHVSELRKAILTKKYFAG